MFQCPVMLRPVSSLVSCTLSGCWSLSVVVFQCPVRLRPVSSLVSCTLSGCWSLSVVVFQCSVMLRPVSSLVSCMLSGCWSLCRCVSVSSDAEAGVQPGQLYGCCLAAGHSLSLCFSVQWCWGRCPAWSAVRPLSGQWHVPVSPFDVLRFSPVSLQEGVPDQERPVWWVHQHLKPLPLSHWPDGTTTDTLIYYDIWYVDSGYLFCTFNELLFTVSDGASYEAEFAVSESNTWWAMHYNAVWYDEGNKMVTFDSYLSNHHQW